MPASDSVNTAIASLASTIAASPDAPRSYSKEGQSVTRDRAADLEKLLNLQQKLDGPFEVTSQGMT
jgi:hypothetical protein